MICYNCKREIQGIRCDMCGAEKVLNSNGNPTWFLNGRAISAPIEEEEAYKQRIKNYPKTKNIIRKGEEEYASSR